MKKNWIMRILSFNTSIAYELYRNILFDTALFLPGTGSLSGLTGLVLVCGGLWGQVPCLA